MKNVTINQLRDILDRETGLQTGKTEDGNLYVCQRVPGYENSVAFILRAGENIEIIAFVLGYETKKFSVNKSLLFCNEWNLRRKWPKCFVDDDNTVVAEVSFDNESDISSTFIARMVNTIFFATCRMFEALHIFCTSTPDRFVLKDARERIEIILRDF